MKRYELSNHLGNVLIVVNDGKLPADEDGNNEVDFFTGKNGWQYQR